MKYLSSVSFDFNDKDKDIDDKARGYDKFSTDIAQPLGLVWLPRFPSLHVEWVAIYLTSFLFGEMYFYKIGGYTMVNSNKYPGCIIEDLLDTFLSDEIGTRCLDLASH